MGYEDNFYKKENILGYTGKIDDDPTVYFASISGKTKTVKDRQQLLTKFGHITQFHDRDDNIGRELVRECYSYAIYNNFQSAKESVYGLNEWDKVASKRKSYVQENQHNVFHSSRFFFIHVNSGNIEILAQAIKNHQKRKKRYG